MRIAPALILALSLFSVPAFSQGVATPVIPPVNQPPRSAADNAPLPPPKAGDGSAKLGVSTVSSSLSVDAVLLPRDVTRRIFGNEIAKNFAIVQMTISNRSTTGAFILHSVLLDYSQ